MKVVVLVVSLMAASVMSIGDDMIGLVIGGFGGRSIKGQYHQNFSLIIFNDSSPSLTSELGSEYKVSFDKFEVCSFFNKKKYCEN